MNCKQIQDELLIHVGASELPHDLISHLAECPDCRTFWSELTSLTDRLGSDNEFYLDDNELDAAASEVDRRIDELELAKVTDARSAWWSFVPAAAAVVLLVGISSIIYLSGWLNGNGEPTSATTDSLLTNGDVDVLAETEYEYILDEFSVSGQTVTGELIFEDITDEELDYLEENFDMGEIL